MPEYHAIRTLLGIAQLCTVWMIRRRDVGYLWWFGCLMFLSGAWNLAPSFPLNDAWKHWIQVPATIIILAMSVMATLEIFAFMQKRTFHAERMLLLDWSVVMAGLAIAASWFWEAENWYQAVMIARQYALIGLTAGFYGAWLWVTWLRPMHIESQIESHGDMWILWLFCATALSTTTKGGIFWALFPREGGEMIWRLSSDALMLAQLFCCESFALNLYHWHGHSPDVVPAYPHGLPTPAQYRLHRR